jgi:biofilm PGA synthesis N-glycosyltransferase PgaC
MLPRYELITPARNEAQFIELSIKSVITQTIWPIKWMIINDGSTDEIASKYTADHWIELVQSQEHGEQPFWESAGL